MRFSSSVHDRYRHHHPTRPWSWSLSLDGLHIAEGQAATVGEADAAVDAALAPGVAPGQLGLFGGGR